MYFLAWSKNGSDSAGNSAWPIPGQVPHPGLFSLPPGGHSTRAFRRKARKEWTSSSWQAGEVALSVISVPTRTEEAAVGKQWVFWPRDASPGTHIPFLFCFVLFYVRASNLSFIPPSKVEYLHFCFDCLTNFSIVTEWLPMSNEVHGFLKGGAFPFFFFQGGHF